MMISTFILSTFHSFQVTCHLALHIVFTFPSLSDVPNSEHIMITLDIVINSQWTDSFPRAIKATDREILSKNLMAGIQIWLQSIRSQIHAE